MKKIKPKVYGLCCSGYDLMYRCGNCGRVFNVVDDNFNYCPNCGKQIDWGVIITVNEEWKNRYIKATNCYFDKEGKWHSEHEEAVSMRDQINDYNDHITDGLKREMPQTEATKKAIIKSNIKYYIGNGWTKEELIQRGFFKEEDFED